MFVPGYLKFGVKVKHLGLIFILKRADVDECIPYN